MNYVIIEGTRKGSHLYVHNQQLYLFHRESSEYITVRCRDWRRNTCKGGGKIKKSDDVFQEVAEHNHPPKTADIKILTMKTKLKRKAEESSDTLREIFNNVSEDTPLETATKVSFNEVENVMFKRRKTREPPLPDSATSSAMLLEQRIDICPSFKRSLMTQNGCALIFTTNEQQLILDVESNHIASVDATFKFCPRFFQQVLCIHLIKNDDGRSHAVPIVICAMTRKTEIFYKELFSVLKSLFPTFLPEVIMVDFETALRNAIAFTYRNAVMKGCWFHYKKAVIRKISKQFTIADRVNKELKEWLSSILAVPLLPQNKILDGFDHLLNISINGINTTAFVAYVKRAWRNHIPPEQLSVNGLYSRTNNAAESFNRQLNRNAVNGKHPNFFHFCRRINQVLHTSYLDACRLNNGLQISRTVSRKEKTNIKRIEGLWSAFNRHNSLQRFFNSVKHMSHGTQEFRQETSEEEEIDDVNNNEEAAESGNVSCRVCLAEIREDETRWCLVPCGHAPFCGPCIERVVGAVPRVSRDLRNSCPVCRGVIDSTIRLFI